MTEMVPLTQLDAFILSAARIYVHNPQCRVAVRSVRAGIRPQLRPFSFHLQAVQLRNEASPNAAMGAEDGWSLAGSPLDSRHLGIKNCTALLATRCPVSTSDCQHLRPAVYVEQSKRTRRFPGSQAGVFAQGTGQ